MKDDHIGKSFEDLLRMDMPESGMTKRDPKKVDALISRADELECLLEDYDINVDLILHTGFNTLAFIALSGDQIDIYDRRTLDLIREGTSYANVYHDDNRELTFELGYADLSQLIKEGENQDEKPL